MYNISKQNEERTLKNLLTAVTVALFTTSAAYAEHCDAKEQINALALNMYHEARGEGADAMQLVGEVTLNRVESKHFPDDICSVVYQARYDSRGNPLRHQCQFSWYCDGRSDKARDKRLWELSVEIATGLVEESIDRLGTQATHYHADWVNPSWSKKYEVVGYYGNHIFYYMGDRL